MEKNKMSEHQMIDAMWDDSPVDVSAETSMIWSIANKLRGPYQSDKYKDVIIPMTIIRRFECALEPTKEKVVEQYERIQPSRQRQCTVFQASSSIIRVVLHLLNCAMIRIIWRITLSLTFRVSHPMCRRFSSQKQKVWTSKSRSQRWIRITACLLL
jgi:hypothetical protein